MITILNATQHPLEVIGEASSVCYETHVHDAKHAIRIARSCIESGHTRVMEFADVTMKIEGYSARVMREMFRHVIGASYLQSSTRYVSGANLIALVPDDITSNEEEIYKKTYGTIRNAYNDLIEMGAKQEDVANILPLGMQTSVVVKINARALAHMLNVRTCSKAYWEFRKLCIEMFNAIASIDAQWKEMLSMGEFKTKCIKDGKCKERIPCKSQFKTYRVFVYGTLKKAERNNRIINNRFTKYICDEIVTGYKLYDMPFGFPCVIHSGIKEDVLHGEVWEVDYYTLQDINSLEGYIEGNKCNHYDRVTVQTSEDLTCMMYAYKTLPDCDYKICTNGIWNYVVNSSNYLL